MQISMASLPSLVLAALLGVACSDKAEDSADGADGAGEGECTINVPEVHDNWDVLDHKSCLNLFDETADVGEAMLWIRPASDDSGTVEAAVTLFSPWQCPIENNDHISRDWLDLERKGCEAGQPELENAFHKLGRGILGVQWAMWDEEWSLAASTPAELAGATTTNFDLRRCLICDDQEEQECQYERSTLDGTLTIEELSADGAVVNLDFDGARGRIATHTCLSNHLSW